MKNFCESELYFVSYEQLFGHLGAGGETKNEEISGLKT